MSKLGKLWTAAVAYVSLLVGAGLSVAGNLADTYRIRGDLVDPVDIALAVGPPLASLLVAELFVSAWPRTWSVQTVRWLATLLVGTLAMVVSWLHINELLLARGQLTLVAILWPLAIDGLAIMAMAKILVTRGHGHDGHEQKMPWPWRGHGQKVAAVMDTMATGERHVATAEMATHGHTMPADFVAMPEEMVTELDAIDEEADRAVKEAAREMVREAEAYLAPATAAPKPAPAPPVISGRPPAVPMAARELLVFWDPVASELTGRQVDELLAAHFGRSARTARRWREIVRTDLTSGPPSS